MRKILTILALMMTLASFCQSGQQLRVYYKSGLVELISIRDGGSISHSRADLSGKVHDDYVTMDVPTDNGTRQFLFEDLDSMILPNGRCVVFNGGTKGQAEYAKESVSYEFPTVIPPYLPRDGRKRSSFEGRFPGQGTGNVTFKWTENDRIRLDVGYQSRAENLSSDGTNASFFFDGADDLEGEAYTVYFPDRTVTIPAVQTQNGADNSTHIYESGDCGVATATRNSDGSYGFTLTHKAAYLCFLPHINYLPSARIDKIELTCSNAIAGTYDLSSTGLYNGTSTVNTITLNLNPQKDRDFFIGHNINTEQDSCAAYMVIATQDANRTFTATYYITDTLSRISKVYHQTFSFRPLANTVYPITCNIRDTEFRSVDLGLSCNWSNVNVDATEPSKVGTYYADDSEANAKLLEQTIVTEWLMPTNEQRDELLENCQWERAVYNGIPGYIVTGSRAAKDDGNVHRIFLPCAEGVSASDCLAQTSRPVEALMVDLGLSVKWASRNLGALSADDFGDFFAWGEVESKDRYTQDNYKYYVNSNYKVLGDDYSISGSQYDAALVNWGGIWRMPTRKEMQELLDNCTWSYGQLNGVNGYFITSEKEGNNNRIFMPMAGYKSDMSHTRTTYGSYFTATLNGESTTYAHTLWFSSSNQGIDSTSVNRYGNYTGGQSANRYFGRSIRAVAAMNSDISGMSLNVLTDSAAWTWGQNSAKLYGTLSSSAPIEGTVKVGFVIGETSTVEKSTARQVITYPQELAVGRSFDAQVDVYDNVGYWYRAYVETADGTVSYGNARHYGTEMVDLGLTSGTRWANMNVGASWSYQIGNYYAWGETAPQPPYTRDSYDHYNSSYKTIGDNGNISGTDYDAAHVNMGNAWRMPTRDEMLELIEECEWTYTSDNGQVGYRVKGTNGNCIFMPTAGYIDNLSNNRTGYGSYFTAVLNRNNTDYASTLWFSSTSQGVDSTGVNRYGSYTGGQSANRYFGRNIRAVATPNAVAADSVLNIVTDSALWSLNATTATLYATLTSTTPLNGNVRVGFVIGDDRSVTVNTARLVKPLTVNKAGSFSQTVDVYQNIGYWCRAYVVIGGTYFYGQPRHYGWELVDLGIKDANGNPVLWANMNVGASHPEETGNYYAWGETTTKESFTQNSYQYYKSGYIEIDTDNSISGTLYDAATVNMGSLWRTPTQAECDALAEGCNWATVYVDGIACWKVSSKTANADGTYNYILMPKASGTGSYMTATRYDNDECKHFNIPASGTPKTANKYKYAGMTVRAVCSPGITTDGGYLSVRTDSTGWQRGDTELTLRGTLSSSYDISNGVTVGFITGDYADLKAGDSDVTDYALTMTATGSFTKTIDISGRNNMGSWYRAYVKVGNNYFYGNVLQWGIIQVDLGLESGNKWANINIGANSPEETGDWIAWGETTSNTSYSTGSYLYCQNNQYQNIGTNISATTYDAAYMRWNLQWHMPTQDEMADLCNNCDWTYHTINGMKCYKVASRTNANYILLPIRGYMNNTSVGGATTAYYWTGNINGGATSNSAYAGHFSGESTVSKSYTATDYRYRGLLIRAVANR